MISYCGLLELTVLALLHFGLSVDIDSQNQLALAQFGHKPYGPFYCKARCVAFCLNMHTASNLTDCSETQCQNFGIDGPCRPNDKKCWQNCGNQDFPDDLPIPPPVTQISPEAVTRDGLPDPSHVLLKWERVPRADLYIVEIFPLKSKDEILVQTMTVENMFVFKRPALCSTFMARIIAVNGYGISQPHYRRLPEWQPDEDIDLQLKMHSISLSLPDAPNSIKVLIDYQVSMSMDVDLNEYSLTASNCKRQGMDGLILEKVATESQSNEAPWYWPFASITMDDDSHSIKINLAADLLTANCDYSFQVQSVKTQCGSTIQFSDPTLNVVNFTVSCNTVANAHCQPNNLFHIHDDDVPIPRAPFSEQETPENDTFLDSLFRTFFGPPEEPVSPPQESDLDNFNVVTRPTDSQSLPPAPFVSVEAESSAESEDASEEPSDNENNSKRQKSEDKFVTPPDVDNFINPNGEFTNIIIKKHPDDLQARIIIGAVVMAMVFSVLTVLCLVLNCSRCKRRNRIEHSLIV